ncbi:unnamed protein product [Rotaria sp. Silwood1]|nr:unnamed protein product [Rotaria sp. Silwood1]
MSDDTDLVAKIFPAIEKHKEAFFVIRLRKPFASYATINDTDTLIQCDLMDTRNAFLYFAHDRHHEFLSLRRAKFSTMALLYELHISTKDKFKSNCNTCRQHCDILNHCTVCEDFNLCETCYNIEPTHEHRMKRSVPSIVSQSQRQRSMQHCIEALSHSGNCRNSTCDKCNCFRYKRIIQHTKECIGPNNQCNRRHEIFSIIRTILLKPFTQWLQQHASSFRQWNRITKSSFDKLGGIIFDFGLHNEKIIGKDTYDDCCKIIDCYILILSTLSNNINAIDESTIDLIGICMFHLYALTLEQSLLDYIKNQQLSSILLRLIDIDNEEAQFNAYRILASIMTEQDIKMLANPGKISKVFITFLTDVIDNTRKIRRLRNLLRCLKCLVQHDQIKEELTKQGILPHLLRCATETKFDPVHEQQPTLEILLALTFHDQAAILLKENSQFISHLHTLINSSSEQGLRRAAEGLLWKLEKEEIATAKLVTIPITKDVRNYKYDIMLSYSHRDKDLCHRIYDRLVKDNFRIWIDRDQMHGSTMVAMADAIENAEFVFVCMSDAYKQSAYCQSEAQYAYERQCHLIPIVMKQNYRPDGRLGIMVSGKIYVDFPKLGFDQAYLKLKNEIDRYRLNMNLSISTQEQQRCESPTTAKEPERTIETITDQSDEQPTITNNGVASMFIKTTGNNAITLEQYQQIRLGWTRDQVTQFVGIPGELIITEEPISPSNRGNIMVQYQGSISSNVLERESTVIFSFNNKILWKKNQKLLDLTSNYIITREHYNQIQTGWTYDQVRSTLGSRGNVIQEANIWPNVTLMTVLYQGEGQKGVESVGYIQLGFWDGKLQSKPGYE